MRITYRYVDCEAKYSNISAKFGRIAPWFSILVLVLSIISLCIIVYNIVKRSIIFLRLKVKKGAAMSWSKYTSFVTGWDIVSIAKDIFMIIGNFLLLIPRIPSIAENYGNATSFFL